jgi:hypothetical protein
VYAKVEEESQVEVPKPSQGGHTDARDLGESLGYAFPNGLPGPHESLQHQKS